MNKDMELLSALYKIHSPSGKEKPMRKFIRRWIENNIPGVELHYDNVGNIYMTRGASETYPCVVAHLDQVQHNHSEDFQAYIDDGVIFGWSDKNQRYEGLGADDKNGIWVALQCLERFDVMKVAFFNSEEIGCVGSSSAEMDFFKDCRFVIQPDRRGAHDLITEIGWSAICSEEFINDLDAELYGYVATSGLMTDVQELSEKGVGLSCINVSCGYYNPHTDQETTNLNDLINCYNFVAHIIEKCTKVYPFKYEAYSYTSYRWRGTQSNVRPLYGSRAYNDDYYGGLNGYNGYDDYWDGYYDSLYDEEDALYENGTVYNDGPRPRIPNIEHYYRIDDWIDDLVGYNFEDFFPDDLWKYVEPLLEGTMTKATFIALAAEKWDEYYEML